MATQNLYGDGHILHVFAPSAELWAATDDDRKPAQRPEGFGSVTYHERVAYFAMVEGNIPARNEGWTDSRGNRHADRWVEARNTEGTALDIVFSAPLLGPCDKQESVFGAGATFCSGHFEAVDEPTRS